MWLLVFNVKTCMFGGVCNFLIRLAVGMSIFTLFGVIYSKLIHWHIFYFKSLPYLDLIMFLNILIVMFGLTQHFPKSQTDFSSD